MQDFTRRSLLQGGTALAATGMLTGPALLDFAKAWAQSAPWKAEPGAKLSKVIQLSEARAIMDTLDACGGRRAEAARQLGISERTLRYRLASFREAGLAMGGRR